MSKRPPVYPIGNSSAQKRVRAHAEEIFDELDEPSEEDVPLHVLAAAIPEAQRVRAAEAETDWVTSFGGF